MCKYLCMCGLMYLYEYARRNIVPFCGDKLAVHDAEAAYSLETHKRIHSDLHIAVNVAERGPVSL